MTLEELFVSKFQTMETENKQYRLIEDEQRKEIANLKAEIEKMKADHKKDIETIQKAFAFEVNTSSDGERIFIGSSYMWKDNPKFEETCAILGVSPTIETRPQIREEGETR